MAIRKILHYPDPRLRRKALPVDTVDGEIRTLIDELAETMYQAPGMGLAAPQIDVSKRVFVIDISEARNDLRVLVNPELLTQEGEQTMEEGCLSVPGVYEEVTRAEKVTVRALGGDGKAFELEVDGLLATCVQHEIDHLDGKLFVDYLSRLKQQRVRKKLAKQQRLVM
ncbi:MAG: peptide deformylase [Gammaproteobacteria bacterium]|nr:peptide deformylase [Gammaproteobacteria bacterium]